MSLSYWPENPHPTDLGVIVHGPALVARSQGIAVAVRCVFALPTGLAVDLVLRATGVQAEAASRRSSGKGSEPVISITADGVTAVPQGSCRGSSYDDYCRLDWENWIDVLPADHRLTIAASWPAAGLAPGQVTLDLGSTVDLESRMLHLP